MNKIRVKVLRSFVGIDEGQTHVFTAGTEEEIAGDHIDDFERGGFLQRLAGKVAPVKDVSPKTEEHPGGPRDEIISTEIETASVAPTEKATGRGAKR